MLGVIADDFTGATDIADVLAARGFYSCVVPFGELTSTTPPDEVDAVIVALKSRTARVEEAVSMSLAAYERLGDWGCEQFYFKYCSTFDSTATGNIGPVIDALLERANAPATIATPAYPQVGRTVYQGHLFVGDRLLQESSMAHHPLTPMSDSDVRRLLSAQVRATVCLVPLPCVRGVDGPGLGAILAEPASPPGTAQHRAVLLVDAIDQEDIARIASAVAGWPLVTGSAGLASGFTGPHDSDARRHIVHAGGRVVLCGSASRASRAQVAFARSRMPSRKIDIQKVMVDYSGSCEELVGWALTMGAARSGAGPVLVYAAGPEDRTSGTGDAPQVAAMIERCLAEVAAGLVKEGSRQLVVAGGEISGAVVSKLGVHLLLVGSTISKGVPWMSAELGGGSAVNVALKSGNFGDDDFFLRAWEVLDGSALEAK